MRNNWPAELILRFKTEDDREYFVANLLDGAGENMAYYEWGNGQESYRAGLPIFVVPMREDNE